MSRYLMKITFYILSKTAVSRPSHALNAKCRAEIMLAISVSLISCCCVTRLPITDIAVCLTCGKRTAPLLSAAKLLNPLISNFNKY